MPVAAALIACLLAAVTTPQESTTDAYTSLQFGVTVPLGESWTHRVDVATATNLHVVFAPLDHAKSVQLTLRAQPAGGLDAVAAQAVSFASVDGKEGYESVAKRTDTLLGQELPGLQLDLDTAAGPFRLRQDYLVRDGVLFILETAVAVSEADDLMPTQADFWNQLRFDELTPEQEERLRLETLADRCGSEIDWAPTWEAAAGRARAEGKPILLTTQQYAGFDIEDQAMRGIFMDEEVIALVEERYVPFRLVKGMPTALDAPGVYGLGPNTFGRACMIVTPAGEVLAEQQSASDRFLRESLVFAGGGEALDPRALRGAGVEQAERLVRRGEFAAARIALTGHVTARAELLRASMFRRERKGDKALAALASARRAATAVVRPGLAVDAPDDTATLLAEVLLQEAAVLGGTGDPEQARANLDRYFRDHGTDRHAPEALVMSAMLKSAAGDHAGAGIALQQVLDSHADSRWAWWAAAALTSPGWERGLKAQIDWPPEDSDPVLRAAVASVERSTEPAKDAPSAQAARAAGIDYLLDHQQEDGSWIAVTEAERHREVPDDFELAITALGVQALLTETSGNDREHSMRVASSIERGLTWLHTAHDLQVAEGEEAYYMDYSVWSRSYLVWVLVDAFEAGFGKQDAVASRIAIALSELAARQQSGGGWSYFLTGDLDSAAGPADVSISFTTATAVLAMARAREAGFDVPPRMLERATGCLERMRNGDGTWTYMLHHRDETLGRPTNPAGEALRGPLCARAILRAHAETGSTDDIVAALDLYLDYREIFSAQLGKTLMHTGPEGQGSHYLMFDYANAAAAIAELPDKQRARYSKAVTEDVLRSRSTDGSFVDTMLLGRAYGTAMAVLALSALEG